MVKFKTFHSQKGGVGKTTLTINYAITLSKLGNRILIIDLDPQGSISSILSGDSSYNSDSSYWLTRRTNKQAKELLENTVRPSIFEGISYVPASLSLTETIRELNKEADHNFVLFDNIALVHSYLLKHFDYVLFDSRPSYDLVTTNIYHAAVDGIILITEPSILSVETMIVTLKDWTNTMQEENMRNNIAGILLNKVNSSKTSKDIYELLATNYPALFLRTFIPNTTVIERAFLTHKWAINDKKLDSWIKPKWLRSDPKDAIKTESQKQMQRLTILGKKVPNGNPFVNLYKEIEGKDYNERN